jgi:hypothetical protein
MKIKLNPLSGRFEIIQSVDSNDAASAIWISVDRDCDSSAAVGDLVYQSPTIDNFVIVNVNNTVVYPTIGIIVEKYSATECKVALAGEIIIMSGLTRAKQVYLSPAGTGTTTSPNNGYLQVLGHATSPTAMIFNPDTTRVKRAGAP